ncbi:MAG: HAMP domain-containing histidine kinase [Bacteroidales bacterium]|nr:HAMP domain-containing histidine kinase [Bacteroidales bacterium]
MKKLELKYRYRLVIYLLILLTLLALFFVLYVSRQSRVYSISAMQNELRDAVELVKDSLDLGRSPESITLDGGIGFTLIDTLGEVLYDSRQKDISIPDNVLSSTEIANASVSGEGSALRSSLGEPDTEYLYYARRFGDRYIRSYSKFEISRPAQVEKDNTYFILIAVLLIALIATFIYVLRRLSKPLSTYSELVGAIKEDGSRLSKIKFGNDELGDVGREIASTFSQLEKAKKYKQQISHNIAHELKTPLTGVRAYLETIINSEDMTPEQMRKFVGKAYSQTIRLADLVDEVSTLNKLDESSELAKADESLYRIEEVNIKSCLDDILEEIGYKLEKNNITFNPRVSSRLKINGCYNLIYSLFKNLIDNSIEHGGSGIEISLVAGIEQVSGEGGYKINFTYTDTGKGVPAEALERIFERFYRVEEGRTRKTGGSGLGLAIVKNAVVFHKGTITASEREGGGIIFKFSLYSLDKVS